MDALPNEIDRIANGTNFNKKNLLNGEMASVKATKNINNKGQSKGIHFQGGKEK